MSRRSLRKRDRNSTPARYSEADDEVDAEYSKDKLERKEYERKRRQILSSAFDELKEVLRDKYKAEDLSSRTQVLNLASSFLRAGKRVKLDSDALLLEKIRTTPGLHDLLDYIEHLKGSTTNISRAIDPSSPPKKRRRLDEPDLNCDYYAAEKLHPPSFTPYSHYPINDENYYCDHALPIIETPFPSASYSPSTEREEKLEDHPTLPAMNTKLLDTSRWLFIIAFSFGILFKITTHAINSHSAGVSTGRVLNGIETSSFFSWIMMWMCGIFYGFVGIFTVDLIPIFTSVLFLYSLITFLVLFISLYFMNESFSVPDEYFWRSSEREEDLSFRSKEKKTHLLRSLLFLHRSFPSTGFLLLVGIAFQLIRLTSHLCLLGLLFERAVLFICPSLNEAIERTVRLHLILIRRCSKELSTAQLVYTFLIVHNNAFVLNRNKRSEALAHLALYLFYSNPRFSWLSTYLTQLAVKGINTSKPSDREDLLFLFYTCSLQKFREGDWEDSHSFIDKCVYHRSTEKMAHRPPDQGAWLFALHKSNICLAQANYFGALEMAQRADVEQQSLQFPFSRCHVNITLAFCKLKVGAPVSEIEKHINKANEHYDIIEEDWVMQSSLLSVQALSFFRQQKKREALKYAISAYRIFTEENGSDLGVMYHPLPSIGFISVLLKIWEEKKAEGNMKLSNCISAHVKASIHRLRDLCSSTTPFLTSELLRIEGCCELLTGNEQIAMSFWNRAIDLSSKFSSLSTKALYTFSNQTPKQPEDLVSQIFSSFKPPQPLPV